MLKELVNKSVYVLREAFAQIPPERIAVLWSTGKDSTLTLWLLKQAFFGEIPCRVLFIDTSVHYKEIYEFRDALADEWGFRDKLVVLRNEEALSSGYPKPDRVEDCCLRLKVDPLKQTVEVLDLKALIVSIRRDENAVRRRERYISPRDRDFKWHYYDQPAELLGWGIVDLDLDVPHYRIHPLLHWTEVDVWRATKQYRLPFNPLYRADYVEQAYGVTGVRFRSLGCRPCTLPVVSTASSIDEIIREVLEKPGLERSGRAQDKEETQTMLFLKHLGYL